VLGGGLGRFEGLYGLTSDNVSKVRYALYNGTIVEASPKVNKDLFWGIRGAGQNFGIAFEITLQTHPATNNGQHYNGDFYFARKDMKKMFDAVNKLAAPKGNPDAFDPRLNMIPIVVNNQANPS
jgi:FAD/FMN-containing dehydrogenase